MGKDPFQKSGECSSRSGCSSAGKDGSGCASCSSKSGSGAPMSDQDAAIAGVLARIKYPVFVMSGKGGVGKSSVSVNVAAALHQRGFSVGLLDVDLHGPSVAGLLGLTAGLDMDEAGEKLYPADYRPGFKVLSIDSLLRDRNTAILWRGPKKTGAIRQFIGDVIWGDLDFLIIDSPPGTGDEHLTILKAIPDALCLVVTTPQEVSLADVRKALNFLQHANALALGVVENMSGLVCPHCGKDIPLFKTGGGAALAAQYGLPFLGAIPLDPATVVAADLGKPVVLLDEPGAAKTAFLELAGAVAAAAEAGEAVRLSLPPSED